MTRDEELRQRRMLRHRLSRMSPSELDLFQDKAQKELALLQHLDPQMSAEVHWAAHRFINIVAFRSFGRLDVPCQHREDTLCQRVPEN